MGCVNEKQLQNISRHTHNQSTQQPQINHDQLHFNTPHIQVSQRACGYLFQYLQKQIGKEILRSKTQMTIQSKSPSLSASEIDDLIMQIQKCNYYYSQHDIDKAYQYLEAIENIAEKYKYSQYQNQQIQKIIQKNKDILGTVKEQYSEVLKFQNQISSGGWVEKSNKKGIKVSTRRQQTTVGVKVESIVDQPFQIFITFCIQMNLYKEFMPFMRFSRQEKIVARNSRIGLTQNHIPLLTVRQAFFQGIGYNRLNKNNTLFLFTRSIHNRPNIQQRYGYNCQVNENYIQLQYKYFVLSYQPICRGKGKIVLAMNVDTKMDFIPLWLQDKISQDFGEQFFQNIMKLSKTFKNSKWQQNTKANPQLFNFFKNAIAIRLLQMEEAQKSYGKIMNVSNSTNLYSNLL